VACKLNFHHGSIWALFLLLNIKKFNQKLISKEEIFNLFKIYQGQEKEDIGLL